MDSTDGERGGSSQDSGQGGSVEVDVAPQHVFGLRVGVQGAVAHLDKSTVLYPAGAFLVAHETRTHAQELVALQKGEVPTAMAVSPRRQFLAVCRAGKAQDPSGTDIRTEGELCAVCVYDLTLRPFKRVRVLVCGEVASVEYVYATFSSDEKVVGVQGGPPDWTLVLFVIEKSKVLSILRLGDTPGLGGVSGIACHPEDPGVLAVVGRKVLKFLRLHDKLLKGYGYQAGLHHVCCSLVWADHYTLLVGTDEGTVLLLEEGELKTTLSIVDPQHINRNKSAIKRRPDGDHATTGEEEEDGGSGPRHRWVTCITMISGGFACACGPDNIFLFQKSESIHEFYLQRHLLLVCEPSPASMVSGRGQHTVTALSADPSSSSLVLATHTGQLFTNVVPSLHDDQVISPVFTPFHAHLHTAGVVAADTCLWKSYCATVGGDRTLLLWNYRQHSLLLQETFKEDLYSVALHPTGFHVAVGLTDSVRLFHVMLHSVRQYWEVRVRRCGSCCFSNGGQYLAAADGNLVTVVHTLALKRHLTLKGHSGKIRVVGWHPQDQQILACGAEGGVLGWDTATGAVIMQLATNQGCHFMESFLTLDGKAGIVAGNAVSLAEVTADQQSLSEEVSEGSTCVAVSAVKGVLVLGQDSGTIALSRVPRSFATGTPQQLPAHSGAVVTVCVTPDENHLITCGADGAVVVWGIGPLGAGAPGLVAVRERLQDLPPEAPEMLVTRDYLEACTRRLEELTVEVKYLQRDKRHHLALQDQQFRVRDKDARDRHQQDLAEQRHQLEAQRQQQMLQEEGHRQMVQDLQLAGEKRLQEQAAETRNKLRHEYSKQDALQQEILQLKDTMEERVRSVETATRTELQLRLRELEGIMAHLQHQLQQSDEEVERERAERKEAERLLEAGAAVEVAAVRERLHTQLAEERQHTAAIRRDKAVLSQTNAKLQREGDLKNAQANTLGEEKQQLQKASELLQRDATALRKELKQRDDTILEKDRELTRTNAALKSLQRRLHVATHRLQQLEQQQLPLQEELQQKDPQIKQLCEANSAAKQEVSGRARQAKELSRRLAGAQGEQAELGRRLQIRTSTYNRLLDGLAAAVVVIHQPNKLKEAIKALNDKHLLPAQKDALWTRPGLDAPGGGEQEHPSPESSNGAAAELLRQRERLERAVAKLQSMAARQEAAHAAARTTLVKENSALLSRLAELQQQLWHDQEQLRQLQSVTGQRRHNRPCQRQGKTGKNSGPGVVIRPCRRQGNTAGESGPGVLGEPKINTPTTTTFTTTATTTTTTTEVGTIRPALKTVVTSSGTAPPQATVHGTTIPESPTFLSPTSQVRATPDSE